MLLLRGTRLWSSWKRVCVVADEVRKLAEQTEASAKDIAKLLVKHKLRQKML